MTSVPNAKLLGHQELVIVIIVKDAHFDTTITANGSTTVSE